MTGEGEGGSGTISRALSLGISPILGFLLVVLKPVGTGQGVHSDQLLDPVFPHLHFLGGVPVRPGSSQRPVQRALDADPQRQALGAAAGAAKVGLSMGLTPVVPGRLAVALNRWLPRRLTSSDAQPGGITRRPAT
jgi:hypothetical protein